ncbi:MAG: sugar transporter [Proteobacteria bacterium]|nr:sugar transporter [Pseudomonadota bacterium]
MFDRVRNVFLLGAVILAPSAYAVSSLSIQSTQSACLSGTGDCQTYSTEQSSVMTGSQVPQLRQSFLTEQNGSNTAFMPGMQQAQPVPVKPVSCARPGELNDFQKYLCRSAAVTLPVFGQRMFAEAGSPFAPLQAMPVGPDYMLNVGDEFTLRTWGQLDAELTLKVDRSGQVFVPRVGNISVVGVPFGGLKQHLTNEIGRVFRNFSLAVTMGQLRSAQVFVVGYAQKPGSYTLGALSTVVNALFAAGGPSEAGSMRRIQLKRGNKVVSEFDLYDLLLKGDKSSDLLLASGDVIYIPSAGPQAAIHGSVRAPAIYELKDRETLKDLIELAGGVRQLAQDGAVSVERVVEQKGRVVESMPLKQAASFAVRGGDIAQLYVLTSRVDQVVSLRGNVAQPVRQAWRQGMKVSDLIANREMLQSPNYWENKTRGEADSVLDQNTAVAKAARGIRADVNEINWDYAMIERVNPVDMSTRLVSFNLAKALDKDPANDLVLQSGDILNIFSKGDIQLNSGKRTRFVRLEGEVAVPGFYEVKEGETLRDLVRRIGGLSPRAYLFGAEFNRESVRAKQQVELEKYADELKQSANRQAAELATNAVRSESALGAQIQAQQTQAMADKLKALRATGRIVLGLKPEDATIQALPTLELEDGDRLFVPHTPGTVDVLGSIYSRNNAFMFERGKRVEDYLQQAGGPTNDAEEGSIHVIRADGSVISAKQKSTMAFWRTFDSTAALPGDTIVVPEKVDRTSFTKNLMDWTQILSNFGLGAAAIKTLK